MSKKTLREACETVQRVDVAVRSIAADAIHEQALHQICAKIPVVSEHGIYAPDPHAILAALDAEREAGRREALEDVRSRLARVDGNARVHDLRLAFNATYPEPGHD